MTDWLTPSATPRPRRNPLSSSAALNTLPPIRSWRNFASAGREICPSRGQGACRERPHVRGCSTLSAMRSAGAITATDKKLDVWKLSMVLARAIYRLTSGYPTEERFGLVSQMRRAAAGVPSHIAEGAARDSNNEFRHFLSIARSSLSELDTQLDLSRDLGFVTEQSRSEIDPLLTRIDKMLYALHQLKKSAIKPE